METTKRRSSLPVAHEEVLHVIARHQHEGTVAYVCEALIARPGAVRRRLEALVERGWATRSTVERTLDGKRRQVVVYSATPAGGRALRDGDTF